MAVPGDGRWFLVRTKRTNAAAELGVELFLTSCDRRSRRDTGGTPVVRASRFLGEARNEKLERVKLVKDGLCRGLTLRESCAWLWFGIGVKRVGQERWPLACRRMHRWGGYQGFDPEGNHKSSQLYGAYFWPLLTVTNHHHHHHHHHITVFGGQRHKIRRSDSLGWLGVRGWYPAFHGTPKLANGMEAYALIDTFLRQTSPPARNFSGGWKIPRKPSIIHPAVLNITFEQLVSNIRSHVP